MINQGTICAVASGSGPGAIAVIRLSGKGSIQICDRLYVSPLKGKKLIKQDKNTIHFGNLQDETEIIDEVLVSVFKAPHSYTGEDSVEISCHGSLYIRNKIVQLLIKNGARMAEPGEFTMRAFLNGKLDLSQAEAVADLIASGSERARQVALNQMRGGFSNEIKKLREQLVEFVSLIELELDFAEEDVEFADRSKLRELLDKIMTVIQELTQSFELGNVIKNGVPVVIAGEPNVGKSTLLNVLLKDDKAIVSEIAGTTRDAIEDVITLNGIQFRFIDTAGLRETTDQIESIGIEKTLQKIEKAAIVLLLADAKDKELNSKISEIKQMIKNKDDKKLIIVINKIDTIESRQIELVEEIRQNHPKVQLVCISAKQRGNIEELTEKLIETVNISSVGEHDVVVTNTRHYEALLRSNEALERASTGLESNLSGDFLSQDIREALHYLGEITGDITTDEVLGNIFAKFCIGK